MQTLTKLISLGLISFSLAACGGGGSSGGPSISNPSQCYWDKGEEVGGQEYTETLIEYKNHTGGETVTKDPIQEGDFMVTYQYQSAVFADVYTYIVTKIKAITRTDTYICE